ncbi:MAG: universal stress protein [Campylobacter sp.]|nr:universal stress protein [Campylobacter sp.]
MIYKKLFFPIGAGGELRERIRGALLVNKFFDDTHLSIIACQMNPEMIYNVRMTLRGGVLFDDFIKSANEELKEEQDETFEIFKKECENLGVKVSENQHEPNSAFLRSMVGLRTEIVKKQSRYCDLVIAAVPENGKITGTFEAAVLKSGKPCIVIPRVLDRFNPKKILVSMTDSTASARALTNSIPLLRQANEVHCITVPQYLEEDDADMKGRLSNYLALHGVNATYEVLKTDGKIPGEVLLNASHYGKYDMIVAGMEADSGIRDVFLGGTSTYFLKNTEIPVFM